jgi:cold shock CspA family protein
MHGIVQSYSTEKGHGFIRGEDNCRYFAHQSEIEPNYLHLRFLDKNELVEFVPSVAPKRRKNNAMTIKPQNRLEESMPFGYWEIGDIFKLNPDGTGWISRYLPHEAIFFTTRDIVTFGPVEIGTKVVFAFEKDSLGRLKASNMFRPVQATRAFSTRLAPAFKFQN